VLVLAVESATEAAGVAVADDQGVLATVTLERGRRHGESIAPAIAFVCERAGVDLSRLDGLCVDVGPGLFTGLRVGVATAKALGFALGIPVVEMSSLEVLALGAARSPFAAAVVGQLLVPVVDARRAQVFSTRFELSGAKSPSTAGSAASSPDLVRVADDGLHDPDALAGELAEAVQEGRRCVCLGDGARRYAELFRRSGAEVAVSAVHPDVAVLAEAGLARAAAGGGRSADMVAARYLRPADVRINWERRMPSRPLTGS
jgi:tRNA threonylcarbamoyladenosine biosynthesis protein TsaB